MALSITRVPVQIPGAHYDASIATGLIAHAGEELAKLTTANKVAIVTDSIVGPLHLAALRQSLEDAGFKTVIATVPAGETYKTWEHVAAIHDALLAAKIERSTPVIALGGGVIGDMAGFAAATVLRGVPFIQFPTTLLAMVDASIGGKTGIDHRLGKNLIGAFYQPIAVFADPVLLTSLPARELRSGLAECIKHDVIRDASGFTHLEQNIGQAIQLDLPWLSVLVAHNVRIKASIVMADPLEQGDRAHLNFGHTFGHAIEQISQYRYSHGEAIALGMVAASRLAHAMEMLDQTSVSRIEHLIAAAGLPTSGLMLDGETIINAMAFDKKVKAGKVRFILPDRIGHVIIRDDAPLALVRSAIESLRG